MGNHHHHHHPLCREGKETTRHTHTRTRTSETSSRDHGVEVVEVDLCAMARLVSTLLEGGEQAHIAQRNPNSDLKDWPPSPRRPPQVEAVPLLVTKRGGRNWKTVLGKSKSPQLLPHTPHTPVGEQNVGPGWIFSPSFRWAGTLCPSHVKSTHADECM